jgi:hypothetical protein
MIKAGSCRRPGTRVTSPPESILRRHQGTTALAAARPAPTFGRDFTRVPAHTATPGGSLGGPATGRGPIPSNTVICLKKYKPCRAPYDPGTWGAKVTYHCPVFPGLPGTTRPAFVTIPDEFIGSDAAGRKQYRCRPRSQVAFRLDVGDTVATSLTRLTLYPDQASCHAGFRRILAGVLAGLFHPSGGEGHTWGGRIEPVPPPGFPCP